MTPNTYPITIHRILDGDTMDVTIHLPLGLSITDRIRIKDLDTPETFRPRNEKERIHGKEATTKSNDLLIDTKARVVVYDRGSFGRILVDIILEDGSDYASVMKESGMSKKNEY